MTVMKRSPPRNPKRVRLYWLAHFVHPNSIFADCAIHSEIGCVRCKWHSREICSFNECPAQTKIIANHFAVCKGWSIEYGQIQESFDAVGCRWGRGSATQCGTAGTPREYVCIESLCYCLIFVLVPHQIQSKLIHWIGRKNAKPKLQRRARPERRRRNIQNH